MQRQRSSTPVSMPDAAMRPRHLAWLLAVAVVASGTAQAGLDNDREMRFPSLGEVEATFVSRKDGFDAQELRSIVDREGNGDGRVDQGEAEDYVRSVQDDWNQGNISPNWTLDGQRVEGLRSPDASQQGLVGPVDSESEVVLTILITGSFPSIEDSGRHELVMGGFEDCNTAPRAARADWTFRTIPGHQIESVNLQEATIVDDGRAVEIRCGTGVEEPFAITYAKPGLIPGLPGPGVPLVALAVVLLARLRR